MKQTVRLFFAAALLAALFACKVPEPVVESTHVPDPTPIPEEAVALATPAMTPVPTPAPTAEPSPKPTPEPMPEPIPSVWIFGREIACDTETLDLSDTESPSPDELSAALPYLKNLKAVALGERDPELAASFRAAFPDLDFRTATSTAPPRTTPSTAGARTNGTSGCARSLKTVRATVKEGRFCPRSIARVMQKPRFGPMRERARRPCIF